MIAVLRISFSFVAMMRDRRCMLALWHPRQRRHHGKLALADLPSRVPKFELTLSI